MITVDETNPDVWLWTIPFPNDQCSIGVVGTEEYFNTFAGKTEDAILSEIIANSPKLQEYLTGAVRINEIRTIVGYASDVTRLYGDRFALLGNAGEFLDPIFSSGVTIALQSARLATDLLAKQLRGEKVNWEVDYSEALRQGVRTFKTFVSKWYSGEL